MRFLALFFAAHAVLAVPARAQRDTPLPDAKPLIINIPGLPSGSEPVTLQAPSGGAAAPAPAAPAVAAAPTPAAAMPPPVSAALAAAPVVAALPAAVSPAASGVPGGGVPAIMPPPVSAIIPKPAVSDGPPAKPPVAAAPAPVAPPAPAKTEAPPPAPAAPMDAAWAPPAPPRHAWSRIDSVEKLGWDFAGVSAYLERAQAYEAICRKSACGQGPQFDEFEKIYRAEKEIGRREVETLQRWMSANAPAEPAKRAPKRKS